MSYEAKQKSGSERMAKWTRTAADVEEYARVHSEIGDRYPSPKLKIRTKNGKTFSGQAIRFDQSRDPHSQAYRGVVTIHTGKETVEIEYLDIDTVERIKPN